MQLDAIKVLAEAPIPILVLEGPDHCIAVANAEWRELFGYRGPDGVAIADLQIFDDAVLTAIKSSHTPETVHIAEARCHDDRYFSATIRAVAGETTLVIVVCRD